MAAYKSYATSDYAQAAATAAQYLEDVGIFDSVTLSGTTISCIFNEETVATFEYSNGQLDITFGPYTQTIQDQTLLWIGKTQSGVLLNHTNQWIQDGNAIYSIAICKSSSGTPMLIYHQPGNVSSNPGSQLSLTCDALSAPSLETAPTITGSAFYSNLAGICTINSAETVAAADKVFRFVERQSCVPLDSISVITIGGVMFMTDGYVAISND